MNRVQDNIKTHRLASPKFTFCLTIMEGGHQQSRLQIFQAIIASCLIMIFTVSFTRYQPLHFIGIVHANDAAKGFGIFPYRLLLLLVVQLALPTYSFSW